MKKYLSLFIIALMALPMIAQVPATRTCGHTDHQHNLMQDADYANAYHQRMQRFQQKEQEVALNGRAQCPNPVVLPMAVHFEGINNPDIACLTALAEQQVQILIDDYAGTNADVTNWTNNAASSFPGVANGEACITFCLATSGHPTGFGLVEGQPAVTFNQFTGDFASGFAGYINIFVRSLNGGVLGFSPLGGSGNGDGVVINTFAFSSGSGCASVVPQAPYNRGRTLTHELGHYLNLNHIWGDGGCGVDDGVTDTPLQGQSYGGCPSIGSATCGSTDMHMNYMDYVNDACMYMFSDGQAARMENYVAANLQNVANNAAATCGSVAPTAGISGPGSGCAPFSATFTDNSGGIPTSWAWSFPGGSPASSNAQNPPAVSYATSGTYNITLTATNAQGSDTETVQITVNDCTGFDCNSINNLNGGTLNLYAVPANQGGGYVSGNNGYGDKVKADYFSGIPASSEMDGVQFAFGVAVGSGNVEFTVWSDNAGSPGTELYTDMVAMSTIIADVTAGNTTLVDFGGQVAIPSSFFVGVKLPTGADTLAVITNSIDDTTPATAWEQWSDDTWYSYDDANSWGINVAHAILPNVCVPSVGGGGAPNANFSVSTISQGCETIQVQYTDNSTNTPTGWSWTFPGGTPASSTAQNPVVAYTSSGSFDATLQASNADGSNSSTQNGVVSVPVALVPNATVNPTTVDIASTATASFMDNSPGATSWMWNFGDGSATSTMQNPTHTYTVTGTYTVTLTVSDGFCTETVTTTVTVVNSLPVEDIEGLSSISLYPNPVSTALNIELVSDVSLDLVIDIYDATGRLVISAGNIAVMGETIHQVDASSLANGTYFVRITNGQNTAVTKFLKF